MDWVEDESIRLLCPCLADVFVGCETPQGFQPAAEVVGGEEVGQVGSELVVRVVVIAVDGRLLDGSVHPLNLPVIRHDGRRRFHTLPIIGAMVRPSGLWGAGST